MFNINKNSEWYKTIYNTSKLKTNLSISTRIIGVWFRVFAWNKNSKNTIYTIENSTFFYKTVDFIIKKKVPITHKIQIK